MQPLPVLVSGVPEEPPDHKQLPDEDGTFMHNFHEHPQANLLTESLVPCLRQRHPDGQFCIGCDSGIYWTWTQPVLNGCKAPDWFYVPGVPPMLDDEFRRSYVLWREVIAPLLVVEFVRGREKGGTAPLAPPRDGSEEHDTTPYKGKFWVYEQGIRADYYVIYDVNRPSVEVYRLVNRRYELQQANAAGRFPIEVLGIELGIWEGEYRGMNLPWLRVWDTSSGEMVPTESEQHLREQQRADTAEDLLDDARRRLDEETERAETERKRADDQKSRAERLAERLRAMGIEPDQI